MAFEINKLYRDKLVPMHQQMWWKVSFDNKTGKDLVELLYDKVNEELTELEELLTAEKKYMQDELESLQKEILKEAKDAQEAIDVLLSLWEEKEKLRKFQNIIDTLLEKFVITKAVLAEAQEKDRDERWSFKEWFYVYTEEIPQNTDENKKRFDYFAKKYPQIP